MCFELFLVSSSGRSSAKYFVDDVFEGENQMMSLKYYFGSCIITRLIFNNLKTQIIKITKIDPETN